MTIPHSSKNHWIRMCTVDVAPSSVEQATSCSPRERFNDNGPEPDDSPTSAPSANHHSLASGGIPTALHTIV